MKDSTHTAHKKITASSKRLATAPQSQSSLSVDALQHISMAAYYKAEQRGFVAGRELDDWVEAEAEYKSGTAAL